MKHVRRWALSHVLDEVRSCCDELTELMIVMAKYSRETGDTATEEKLSKLANTISQ
jgi:hypothetical protein